MNTELRKDCPMRHEFGNCLPAGGFCTAVNDPICEALHNAYDTGRRAAFIQARREAEKNEPLTIEELQQLDEQPVWVKPEGAKAGHGMWCVVSYNRLTRRVEAFIPGIENTWFEGEEYGKTWQAYRHKPKEA